MKRLEVSRRSGIGRFNMIEDWIEKEDIALGDMEENNEKGKDKQSAEINQELKEKCKGNVDVQEIKKILKIMKEIW